MSLGVATTDIDGTTDLLDLYYRTPFAHQLTNKEVQILKAGGFFAGGPVDFDRDRIEQYFTDNTTDFFKEFKQDSRITTWIAKRAMRLGIMDNKKAVLQELQAKTPTGKGNRHTDTRTRHRGSHPYRDVHYTDPQALRDSQTQQRGPPSTSQYPRWSPPRPPPQHDRKGGKGKHPHKGTSLGDRDLRYKGNVHNWGKGKHPHKGKATGKGKGSI